ncbi:DUF916 and DUF3324 domain-containing protein [Listeria ilorinensis]|uniref:DUF916 and DUF3324 domain-containing protein n=1 Tax=Listeria ilorinensis TaxID=2867439 RepID=UPI001EF56890|nr:DUF916 and DUF3324 domain-containing protein [Listeria ilorinensis]
MKKMILGLMAILLLISPILSLSRSHTVQAAAMNFSVETILPDNQQDKDQSYFDLKVAPSQKQTLTLQLYNDTNKDVTVISNVHTAVTNLNGVVEYGGSKSQPDQSIPAKMEDILKLQEKEVVVPKQGTAQVRLDLTMPEQSFDGILVGGISLQEKEKNEANEETDSEGLSIENLYAYNVAVVLQETDIAIDPNLKMTEVEPAQINARNVINATLVNPEARFLNQLSVDTKITKKGEKEALYKSSKKGMQMAPNSTFAYPTALDGKEFEPGIYTMDLTAKSSGKTWHFTQDFEIKRDVAKAYNDQDVTVESDHTWLYFLIGGLILLVLILMLIWWIRRKMKKKEAEHNQLKAELEALKETKQD